MRWLSLFGKFEYDSEPIVFKGGLTEGLDHSPQMVAGGLVSNELFGEGQMSADIEFVNTAEGHGCEHILFFDPSTQFYLTAGFASWSSLVHVRSFNRQTHWVYSSAGDRSQLQPGTKYRLAVSARGSRVTVRVNGIRMLVTDLQVPLPLGQAGLWCMGERDIKISKFTIVRRAPKVFVMMEFSQPFNEFYESVIRPVCDSLGLEAVRADDVYGPGLIIADIAQQISEAKVVVAEVTTDNPNVYYELGFAHALRKPTILIAEKKTKLPFDVAPFRTLFYENSIGGKEKAEEKFRRHLEAIQVEWAGGLLDESPGRPSLWQGAEPEPE